ncbi:MAG TPA: peptidylprolyl isomerase [Gemmatimonadales bacterium]|nr:peptidylprolyl isomerase [Gemmatimonadales bacterium]
MRWVPLVLGLGLAGCGTGPAATAAGQTLTVNRLARWIAEVRRTQPRSSHYEAIAALYVDDMLFADAVARGRDLDDSLLILAARWPLVAQLRWTRLRDVLATARGPLTSAEVDSAYQAGRLRLMQHVLLRLWADAPPATVARTEARAETLRREIVAAHGTTFAAVARRYSEDPLSRAGGGYLNVGGREEFLSPFDTVAWSLAPGEISAVTRSPFGFHIIRRPPLEEVRAAYAAGLARLFIAHEDSARLRRLAAAAHVLVEANAPELVREMLGDLIAARTDQRWLVRWEGGGLRVTDVARWLFALEPGQVALLPTASDAQVRQFLEVIAARELVLAEADSAHVGLSPTEWQTLRAQHDSSIRDVEEALGVTPAALGDATPDARRALAATHVLAYLDRMFGNNVPFVAVPPLLASVLRDSATWSINRRGVAAAGVRADQLLAAGAAGPGGPAPLDTAHGKGP